MASSKSAIASLILTKLGLDMTPTGVGVGVAGLQTDGLVIVGDRLLELTEEGLDMAPMIVGAGVVGSQSNGLIEVCDRLLILT